MYVTCRFLYGSIVYPFKLRERMTCSISICLHVSISSDRDNATIDPCALTYVMNENSFIFIWWTHTMSLCALMANPISPTTNISITFESPVAISNLLSIIQHHRDNPPLTSVKRNLFLDYFHLPIVPKFLFAMKNIWVYLLE